MNEDTRQEFAALQELAQPFRFKVGIVDGEAVIFGKKGEVEWHQFDNKRFAAYTNSSKTINALLKLPWMTVHQRGDRELRALFPRERFSEVAEILRLRRKRPVPKPETIEKGLRALEAQRQPPVHTRISVQMTLFQDLAMEKEGKEKNPIGKSSKSTPDSLSSRETRANRSSVSNSKTAGSLLPTPRKIRGASPRGPAAPS